MFVYGKFSDLFHKIMGSQVSNECPLCIKNQTGLSCIGAKE